MIIDKSKALQTLRPGAAWSMFDKTITWLDESITQPTEAEIATEMSRLQAEYDAQQYSRSRVTEYPEIGDQLDALFHAGVFPAEMAAEIQAVKDKYPKA